MANLLATHTYSLQDPELIKVTIDEYDDGTRVVRSGGGTVTAKPSSGALTDRSTTLTTAGSAQTLASANSNRQYLALENLDPTNALWYSLTGTAAASTPGSRQLGPGDAVVFFGSFVPTNALSVVGTVNSHKCSCAEG